MRRFLSMLRCIPVSSRRNEMRNIAQPAPPGLIRSQWDLPGYRVGWGHFGRVGCEITAVYNVLRHLGRKPSLPELIRQFTDRRSLMLGGLGGTDPFAIGPWLNEQGICAELYAERRSYPAFRAMVERGTAPVYILSYWTNPWNLHTVAFTVGRDGRLTVYNRRGITRCDRLDDVTEHLARRFILGYVIRG